MEGGSAGSELTGSGVRGCGEPTDVEEARLVELVEFEEVVES